MRAELENGKPPAAGEQRYLKGSPSPMPNSPAADSAGLGAGAGTRWEATTNRYLAKHGSGSHSPAPSPRASSLGPGEFPAAPTSNGAYAAGSAAARGHSRRHDESLTVPSARSRNPPNAANLRKPPKSPRSRGDAGEHGSGGKGETRRSSGAGSGKSKEVSFGGGAKPGSRAGAGAATASPLHSKKPPAVTPEQMPVLLAKLRSTAAPEVVAGAKGLWALVCAGHVGLVAKEASLLDSLALVIGSATTQGRFYALAVVGEMAFCNARRSLLIAEHASLRAGLVRVLHEGKGIEGEAAKVVRNSSANDGGAAQLWAAEPGLLHALVQCCRASSYIKACVVGSIYAMARDSKAALLLGQAGVPEKLLDPCLKASITSDHGPEVRDRERAALACAAMALLCIRQVVQPPSAGAEQAQAPAAVPATVASGGAAAEAASALPVAGAASAAETVAGGAQAAPAACCEQGANGAAEGVMPAAAHTAAAAAPVAETEDGARRAGINGTEAARMKGEPQAHTTAVVLERRALVQLVRVLQSAVDSVVYGGVRFSLESALHAMPAAVAAAANVSLLCELGLTELLVAVVKQFSTEQQSRKTEAASLVGAAAAPGEGGAGAGATSLHALALCVRVMRRMCALDLGPTTQGLCVQRLNIVGAPAVISTLVSHLDTTLLPSGTPVGAASAPAAPASPTQGQQPDVATPGPAKHSPASVSRGDVLADARVVLSALSQTQSLSSP